MPVEVKQETSVRVFEDSSYPNNKSFFHETSQGHFVSMVPTTVEKDRILFPRRKKFIRDDGRGNRVMYQVDVEVSLAGKGNYTFGRRLSDG